MSNALTIVMGYRDRELARVERCLASLAAQTRRDFVVHFVDYGSHTPMAAGVEKRVTQFPFARYIYTDTRGWAWNRSRALNTGIRLAQTAIVMTTDVDMVFAENFVATVLDAQDSRSVVHCAPRWLPASFSDGSSEPLIAASFPLGDHAQRGGCQCMPMDLLQDMRGFDEYYARWGMEDMDLASRLTAAGLREAWVEDRTALFHQWHPVANHQIGNLITDIGWTEILRHYLASRRQLVRNPAEWGQLVAKGERSVYRFVDPETRTLRRTVPAQVFDDDPADVDSLVRLCQALDALPPGQAMVVRRADFPRRTAWKDSAIRRSNNLLAALGVSIRCGYPVNRLHPFVEALVERGEGYCEDYFFGLTDLAGATLLLKR